MPVASNHCYYHEEWRSDCTREKRRLRRANGVLETINANGLRRSSKLELGMMRCETVHGEEQVLGRSVHARKIRTCGNRTLSDICNSVNKESMFLEMEPSNVTGENNSVPRSCTYESIIMSLELFWVCIRFMLCDLGERARFRDEDTALLQIPSETRRPSKLA